VLSPALVSGLILTAVPLRPFCLVEKPGGARSYSEFNIFLFYSETGVILLFLSGTGFFLFRGLPPPSMFWLSTNLERLLLWAESYFSVAIELLVSLRT